MGLRVGSTVLNVSDVERALNFWTQALGYITRDPDGDLRDFAVLCPREQHGPNVSLQRSSTPKAGVNRVHLDLYADDRASEVTRLEALGAKRVEPWPYKDGDDFIVMADPDGNEFCVVQIA